MTRKIKFALAAALIAAFASPAFAHDEWFVDSGRYLNGQIVFYDQAPADRHVVAYAPPYGHVVAYAGTRRTTTRIIEGRSSANIGLSSYYGGSDYSATSREELIHAN
jgi:hypothetical protein